MKKVAILQSNYIPWKGYFDVINCVDTFVIYDIVQYTKHDWRNRNKIKSPNGPAWLTIPIVYSGESFTAINQVHTKDSIWREKHWKTISQTYSKTPYFKEYKQVFEQLYLHNTATNLSEINLSFLKAINSILNIKTEIVLAADFELPEDRNERLVHICKQLNATHYVSGPAAKDYLDEGLFNSNGIIVEWMDYSGYPHYTQHYPPFEHGVTVLDLLFNEGPNAHKFMKSFK